MEYHEEEMNQAWEFDPTEPGFPSLALEALNELCIQMNGLQLIALRMRNIEQRVYELEMRAGMHDSRGQLDLFQRTVVMAWTREKWIAMATERWDGKYDYSKVNWNGVKNKITIICPEYGEIDMLPNDHVAKRKGSTGCRHCGSKNKNKDRKVTWE